ncbi:MAG: alpha/beta fold hydrolase, partial [Thermoflexales bacterium]|nr:alpha/beta fold hydrolase [Thermoflexales bacterium]
RSPARVWALVLLAGTLRLVAPPPSPIPLWTRVLQGARIDRDYFEGLRRGPAQACYDTLKPFYADLAGLPEADRRFLFQRVNERVWDEAQRLAALSVQAATLRFFLFNMARIRRGIARLPVPTLVAWGDADRIMPTANLQPRVDAQPGARGALLDGVGHLPQQEHPERLLDRLLPHLQRHAPGPEK